MESFHWDACFVTGIDEVDAQHHRLVDLINDFGGLLASHQEDSSAAVDTLLQELVQYAHHHFEQEESFMLEVGVDPRHVGPHQRSHAQFLEAVARMCDASVAAAHEAGAQVLKFLIHWLAYHILGTDQSKARPQRL